MLRILISLSVNTNARQVARLIEARTIVISGSMAPCCPGGDLEGDLEAAFGTAVGGSADEEAMINLKDLIRGKNTVYKLCKFHKDCEIKRTKKTQRNATHVKEQCCHGDQLRAGHARPFGETQPTARSGGEERDGGVAGYTRAGYLVD